MPATITSPNALGRQRTTIESFLNEIGVKQAEAHTEPGSQGGATTHPIKNVDDNTQVATEGARSAENTKDVKEDQGKPSVDSTPEAKPGKSANDGIGVPGTATADHYNIGLNVAPTGEDPSTETARAKAGKQDGGYKGPSTHPARTDNNELDGFKYAELDPQTADLAKMAAEIGRVGNAICAEIIKGASAGLEATPGVTPPPNNVTPPVQTTQQQQGAPTDKSAGANPPVDPNLAHQIGYQMAGLLNGTLDKAAADAMVHDGLKQTIKQAMLQADAVCDFLDNREYALRQQQQQAQQPRRYKAADFPGGSGGGGAPMPPPPPGGEGGGPPAGPEAGGGGEGGGQNIEQILQLLEQMGVSPEELEQMLAEQGGGASGGSPPGAGGPPPGMGGAPPPPPMGGGAGGPPPGMEVAASANPEAIKAAAVGMIQEIVRRSRAKRAADQQRQAK